MLDFFRNIVRECQDDDIIGLASEMAYWLIFALFPFFIFLAALTGIVGRAIGSQDLLDSIMDNLYSTVGYTTAEALRKPLAQVLAPESGALSIGAAISALIAFNTASSAIGTAMKACNRAYGIRETRHFVVQKGMALGSTLLLTISLIGGTLLLSLGGHLIAFLRLGPFASTIVTILRFGGGLVGIVVGFALFYWFSPNLHQPFRWVFPGVVVATVGLIAFTYLFVAYVQIFAVATFNQTYGAIGGVVLFLFFLRLASIIVLVGAELNAEFARRRGQLGPLVRAQQVEAAPAPPRNPSGDGITGRLSSLRVRRPRRIGHPDDGQG